MRAVLASICLLASLSLLAGCDDAPRVVVVDVQTDLVPGLEFQSLRTELGDRAQGLAVSLADDFSGGRRAAEFNDVPRGTASLAISLLDDRGELIVRRDVTLDVQESVGVTVVLTRNCIGVACADGTDGSAPTTCVDGRCVPRDCSTANPTACGTPGCEVRSDCAVGVECAVPDCVEGICLAFGDASRCESDELCQPDVGCVPRPAGSQDMDDDGVLDSADCDPADPSIGFRAERPCTSACATGLERCVNGEWASCDAPTDCTCAPSDTRQLNCGSCGLITQTCEAGAWVSGACEGQGACVPGALEDVGSCERCGTQRRTCLDDCTWDTPVCTTQGECEAGAEERDSVSCGTCGESRDRSRTCSSSCAWGAWSDFGACGTGTGCEPGAAERQTRACGNCGTESRERVCTSECVFGVWDDWGACEGEGVCAPSTPQTETRPCGSCAAGTELRSRTCTAVCDWAGWSGWGACSARSVVVTEAGFATTFSILSDGALWANGANDSGQRGVSGAGPFVNARVGTEVGWTAITSDGQFASMAFPGHSCGIRAGELYCWGRNWDGQLGVGATSPPMDALQRVGGATDWTHVSAGLESTCGIRAGELYCWGRGDNGRLGTGGTAGATAPARVGTASDWTAITVGWTHGCGLRAGGTLWCWGQGSFGRVGDGADVDVLAPVRIAGTWSAVAAGHQHTCGVRAGELFCWGRNQAGQLGLGPGAGSSLLSPQRVGSASGWTHVAAGEQHSCAIRAGELHCFGDGEEGQLGDGAAVDSDVPVRVGTQSDWNLVTAGSDYTCAQRAGGRYCFGKGGVGRLGTGDSVDRPRPEEVCF